MKNDAGRPLLKAAKIAGVLALGTFFYFILRRQDWSMLRSIGWQDIALASALLVGVYLFSGMQYFLSLRAMGCRPAVSDILFFPYMQSFWGLVIPFHGTSIFALFYLKKRYSFQMTRSVAMIIFLYIFNIPLVSLAGLIYSIFADEFPAGLFGFSLFALFAPFCIWGINVLISRHKHIFFIPEKIQETIVIFFKSIGLLFSDMGNLAMLLCCQFARQICMSILFVRIAGRLNPDAGVEFLWGYLVTVSQELSLIIKFTPGNLGLNEAVSALVSHLTGVPAEIGLIAAMFASMLTLIQVFAIGGFGSFLLFRNRELRKDFRAQKKSFDDRHIGGIDTKAEELQRAKRQGIRALFFFVHPGTFHVLNPVIRKLIADGNEVDIAIINKDVLPELMRTSGLPFTDIFPEGRHAKNLLHAGWLMLKTVWRMEHLIGSRQYDLFVTDDCLSINGRLRNVPTLFIIDDDIDVVPEISPLLYCTTEIVAPQCVRLGRHASKRIGFVGYKELAYLHPDVFSPDPEVPRRYGLEPRKYIFIRTVGLLATHDRHKRGIDDEFLTRIVACSEKHNLRPVISSERPLAAALERYHLKFPPREGLDLLGHSALFVGDSQTMTSEAALLGIPALRCNDFVGHISVMEERESKYGLSYSFLPEEREQLLVRLDELAADPEREMKWKEKHRRMLAESADICELLLREIRRMGGAPLHRQTVRTAES